MKLVVHIVLSDGREITEEPTPVCETGDAQEKQYVMFVEDVPWSIQLIIVPLNLYQQSKCFALEHIMIAEVRSGQCTLTCQDLIGDDWVTNSIFSLRDGYERVLGDVGGKQSI